MLLLVRSKPRSLFPECRPVRPPDDAMLRLTDSSLGSFLLLRPPSARAFATHTFIVGGPPPSRPCPNRPPYGRSLRLSAPLAEGVPCELLIVIFICRSTRK